MVGGRTYFVNDNTTHLQTELTLYLFCNIVGQRLSGWMFAIRVSFPLCLCWPLNCVEFSIVVVVQGWGLASRRGAQEAL